MFRDSQTQYVIISVVLIWVFMAMASIYEVVIEDKDSPRDTLVAILYWLSPSAVLSVAILGTREAIMVLAERYRKRRDEEIRKEVDEAWRARLKEAGIDPDTLRPIDKQEQ